MSKVTIPNDIKDFTIALEVTGGGSQSIPQVHCCNDSNRKPKKPIPLGQQYVPIFVIRRKDGKKIQPLWGGRKRKWLICVQNDMKYTVSDIQGNTITTITVEKGFVCDGVYPWSKVGRLAWGQINDLEAAILRDWLIYIGYRKRDRKKLCKAAREKFSGRPEMPDTSHRPGCWKSAGFGLLRVMKTTVNWIFGGGETKWNASLAFSQGPAYPEGAAYGGDGVLKFPMIIKRKGKEWSIYTQSNMEYTATHKDSGRYRHYHR